MLILPSSTNILIEYKGDLYDQCHQVDQLPAVQVDSQQVDIPDNVTIFKVMYRYCQ